MMISVVSGAILFRLLLIPGVTYMLYWVPGITYVTQSHNIIRGEWGVIITSPF